MKNLVSCAMSRMLDTDTRARAALSPLQLMEKASLRLYDALKAWASGLRAENGSRRFPEFPSGVRIVALCGKGDNGGDAMAILRHAAFDAGIGASAGRMLALRLGADTDTSAAAQAASLAAMGIPCRFWDASCAPLLAEADILIDGIFGTGIRDDPRGAAREMMEACNAAGRPLVVSVDLPSGAGDSMEAGRLTVRADATLCLAPLKTPLCVPGIAARRGTLIEVRGVFPSDGTGARAEAHLLEAGDLLPPQDRDRRIVASRAATASTAYKTARGRVAVFAGSPGAAGAASLCAQAALRAGAGYVAVFADDGIAPAITRRSPELMVRPRSSSEFRPEDWDIALAGPGWGRAPGREEELSALLGSGLPLVLDADAILPYVRLLRSGGTRGACVVLTPHPGELRTAFGTDPALAAMDPLAALAGLDLPPDAAIILKSHVTWLGMPGEPPCVWEGLEEGLAIAGSGDVLAGLLAGTWASLIAAGRAALSGDQKAARILARETRAQAMRRAVIAHGQAGKNLRASKGWFLARQIAAEAGKLLGA